MPIAFLPDASAPVLYLLVGAVSLWLVDRLFRRVSWAQAGVLLALPLVLTAGALFTDAVLAPLDVPFATEPWRTHRAELGVEGVANPRLYDVAAQHVPYARLVRDAWAEGAWPLWNFHSALGEPLLGSAQAAPFFLPTLLGLSLSLPAAIDLAMSLHFLAAALSMFLLVGALGCRGWVAVLGAAGWSLCQFVVFWAGWPMGHAVALVPALLYGIDRLLVDPRLRFVLLVAAVASQIVHAGHPETAAHTGLVVVLFLGTQWRQLVRRRGRRGRMSRAVQAVLLALLASSAFVLPVVDTMVQSAQWSDRSDPRLHEPDLDYAASVLESAVVPWATLAPPEGVEPAPRFFTPGSSPYAGSVIWPLALLAAVHALSRRGRRVRGWLVLTLFGLAAGSQLPVITPLLGSLPLFDRAIHHRLVFLGTLGLLVLACFGLERLLRTRRPGPLAVAAGLWALMNVATALVAVRPSGLAETSSLSALAVQLVPLGVLAGLAVLLARKAGQPQAVPRARPGTLVLVALALLVAQRGLEVGDVYEAHPPELFYPLVAPLDALPRDEAPYRVVGWGHVLVPDYSVMVGLDDVRGYSALHHRRQRQLWSLWGRPEGFWFVRITDLGRPMLDFLNVRFALAPTSGVYPSDWQPRARDGELVVLENERARGRVFIPGRVRILPADEESEEAVRGALLERDGLASTVFLETDALPAGVVDNRHGFVSSIARRGMGYVVDVELEAASWLVLSETRWRGWRARCGDRPLATAWAQSAFLGIRVPPDCRRVDIEYRPWSFDLGLMLTAGTPLVLLVLLWRRRRPVDS